mgnify:CR=1 FL=1
MNKEDITLLEKEGWIVECQSPFEIYHEETNSRATGYAAEIILASFKHYNIDKCFLTTLLKFAKHEAQEVHAVCENKPCLGEACLTRQIIKKASTILSELDELSDI